MLKMATERTTDWADKIATSTGHEMELPSGLTIINMRWTYLPNQLELFAKGLLFPIWRSHTTPTAN